MAGVPQAVEENETGGVLPSRGHHHGFRHVAARDGDRSGLRTLPAHTLNTAQLGDNRQLSLASGNWFSYHH